MPASVRSLASARTTITPAISQLIVASADDGRWYRDGAPLFTTTGVAVIVGTEDPTGQNIDTFLRFRGIAIPQKATIRSAFLSGVIWQRYANWASGHLTLIYGNAIGNAIAPTNTTQANALVLTSASVAWDNLSGLADGTAIESSDIKTIIQEIVDRADWKSGNALQIVWRNNGSPTKAFVQPYAWDGSETSCLKLTITYSWPAPVRTLTA